VSTLNQFIEKQLSNRKKEYLTSPPSILRDYNIERENIQAYNGRQLLEMLQNADDASENAKDKKVLIKLHGNELIIANNGDPFSEDGFRSLFYSHLSPKMMQPKKIGEKGLGFRSILSWSEEVIIISGGVKIGFSEEFAHTFLHELISESHDVKEYLKRKSRVRLPIATLGIPKLFTTIDDPIDGYDTIISIKLKKNIFDEVQSQILSIISRETLIFLNNIEEIEIDSPQSKVTYKKKYKNKRKKRVTVERIDLLEGNIDKKSWNIRRKYGKHKEKNYELAIAWDDELSDTENVIYSYFKTHVRFPFPALLHGTFELSPSRNQLVNDVEGHNKYLTGKLVDLLIETSLEIASHNKKANYKPLTILSIDCDNIDSTLIEFDFKETLLSKIKESKVFPSVNGNYFNYVNQPVYYDYQIANILSGKDVANLMPYYSNREVVSILDEITLYYYGISKFISIISERVVKLSKLNLTKLLYLILRYENYIEGMIASDFDIQKQSQILLDVENNPIPWDTNIFIQPEVKIEFKLPKSLKIRFIHPDLIELLLEEFSETEVDFLIDKLKVFRVKNYSIIDISETLIHHYMNRKNITTKNVKELHFYLFSLYKREKIKNNLLILESGNQTPIISDNGKITTIDNIYFGKHYDSDLMEHLYAFDKSKLLASPRDLGLEKENIELVVAYFQWLGVADLPRYQTIDLTQTNEKYEGYIEHILRNYDYKKSIGNKFYRDYNHLTSNFENVPIVTVGYFDELNKILTKSKPDIIFQWIKRDERLRKALEENLEFLEGTKIKLNIKKDNYIRNIESDIRSYTKWLFATTAWMPIESRNKKASPDKCCLSKTITLDFSPFVEKPKLDFRSISDKLKISEDVLENYLAIVGVHRDIGSFSISALYELLASLPTSDKDEKTAKRIYREIINNLNDNNIDKENAVYNFFVNEGYIFCRKGNELGYYPVSEAYYLPTKMFGSNVLKLFPLAVIEGKQGSQKIEKLFGIKRLKDLSFNIVGAPIMSMFNEEFQNDIERFKELVYVLRMHKDSKEEIANKLRKLKIFLSQELNASFTHNEQVNNFKLEMYEHIKLKNQHHFYISVLANLSSLSQLRESNEFCQSIAEIFSIVIDTEEYQDFIHDLYSKPEGNRRARINNYTDRNDDEEIIESINRLNIDENIRLSFWRAFSIASRQDIKMAIRNEKELNDFIETKLKFGLDRSAIFSSKGLFTQLDSLANQEYIYGLFIEFDVDFTKFTICLKTNSKI